MGKTVAITGVNSYFAATLLPKLEDDPTVDTIIGVDTAPWKGEYAKVQFFKTDIRDPNLAKILNGVDTVFHLAFIVGEIRNKKTIHDININGTKNVFDACVKAGVRKIVYASSATVYGATIQNPLGITEDRPLFKHSDSYYSAAKVEIEQLFADYAEKHPNIVFSAIRAALLFGPKIDNMFSKLFAMKLSALTPGVSYNQYIHEEDLGDALYLSFSKDLPGAYNVGGDDAISARDAFNKAGVLILTIPAFLLKWLAAIGFMVGIFPAGGGWVTLSRYTIFMNCDKFKSATGWRPKWGSEATFNDFLNHRG
jgi:UDP-glucose 4-epimerase